MLHNCHLHIFTIKHVPDGFAGLRLFSLRNVTFVIRRVWPVAWVVMWAIRAFLWAIGNPDKAPRLFRFIAAGLEDTQSEVFERIRYYYPSGTRYIVLPMDMEAMGRGRPKIGIMEQHRELLELRDRLARENEERTEGEGGPEIIPFGHIDPRRENALELFTALHDEGRGVQGLKIYPNLGYAPDHETLLEQLYPYCREHDLPVMTHCSSGGVKGVVTGNRLDRNGDTVLEGRALSSAEAGTLADPDRYVPVLERFPELRLCLAHFGGLSAWQQYFKMPKSRRPENSADRNWLSKILYMLTSGKYPNLYTDISYTIFYFEDYHRALKIFLQNPVVLEKALFGSDFYMTEVERFSESQLSISLRAELGEEVFNQISQINPQVYLRGSATVPAKPLI